MWPFRDELVDRHSLDNCDFADGCPILDEQETGHCVCRTHRRSQDRVRCRMADVESAGEDRPTIVVALFCVCVRPVSH